MCYNMRKRPPNHGTVCPGSSDPFYIVSYYTRWVITSWTHSMNKYNSGHAPPERGRRF